MYVNAYKTMHFMTFTINVNEQRYMQGHNKLIRSTQS